MTYSLTTISAFISAIDVEFPVAGQDNDSQGFRTNFNKIKESLSATVAVVGDITNTISTLGGTQYTTATHVHALEDVKIGTTNSVLLSVVGNNIVANFEDASMVLIGLSQTIDAQAAYALTDSVTDSTATTFALTDSTGILVGATVSIGGTSRTVTTIDYDTNYISVTPAFTVPSFAVGDTLTFSNPSVAPVGNLNLDGDIIVTGNITAFAGSPSDERLKENITTVTNALSMVGSMRGVFFDWTDEYLETINFSPLFPKHDIGVIAQEMEAVLPEVVAAKPNGSLTVKYEKLVSVLIEAVKELNTKVEELQSQVNALTTSTNV